MNAVQEISLRAWFSGRMRPCQGRDGSSILPARTNSKKISILLVFLLFVRARKYPAALSWEDRKAESCRSATDELGS